MPVPRPQADRAALSCPRGLKKELVDLGSFSTATIRRLDLAYTSVLEKLGILHGTIAALTELAGMSQGMNDSFAQNSQDLVRELQAQLDALGDFDDQQKRIHALEDRIRTGSATIQQLSGRLDAVRGRTEGWERADREWQERTRKRLKIMWTVMSVVVFLLALLLIAAQYAPEASEGAAGHLANDTLGKLGNSTDRAGERSWDAVQNETTRLQSMLDRTGGDAASADDRLRVFDEL